MSNPRIVVVGGGFAGIHFIRSLQNAPFSILLLDKSNHHLFQPLLYQVATAALSPSDIAYPLREIFRNQKNTTVLMGEVVTLSPSQKLLTLEGGETIGYDYLVLAIGSSHSYFGQQQWQPFAPGLKTLTDALMIKERILRSFEIAERIYDQNNTQSYLTFVVIGGGPTGVEMAGAIAEISRTALKNNFRRIQPHTASIYLIEALDHILPSYPPSLSQRAKKDLLEMGIQVITGKKVTNISPEGVQVEDLFLETKNIIWAAGNQAPKLLLQLQAPVDKQGRILVEKDLSIPQHPEVFAIGDCAHYAHFSKPALPSTASVAIAQGKHLASVFRRQKQSTSVDQRPPFIYKDKGCLATIGKGKAVARVGNYTYEGLLAWITWGLIHIFFLIGWRNKISVFLEWTALICTGKRGARLIQEKADKHC